VVTGKARGDLALAYHWGGSDAVRVHLAVRSDWSLKTLYDVIAVMPGSSHPDEWVVRGNHHDGWVFGASDPLTGQVALMSEAKAIGALARTGWRPARTLVYASWDGEEAGLLGSTEWAEAHADELARKAVVYINTDGNGRGFLEAEGSHDLQHFINTAARDVTDPQTGTSVLDRLRAKVRADAYAGAGRRAEDTAALDAAKAGGDMPVGPLGSGSDYSAFLQHLGIASINVGFGGEGAGGGSYHSAYDSYFHVTHFDDPGLAYGPVLAKLTGRLVLRAADDARLPMRYGDFAGTVQRYVGEVKKLAADQREKDRTVRALASDGVFKLASNPEDPTSAPEAKPMTPVFDMLALEDAADHLTRAARAADAALDHLGTLPPATRSHILTLLRDIDQTLLDPTGLPGRPWFRNLVYAPGTLTGYGAKTLPGVREAIEQRRFDDATAYVARTAAVLNAYAARLDAVVGAAKG
jgi:N-acetylated-alpha-linked acidic dipeptidase